MTGGGSRSHQTKGLFEMLDGFFAPALASEQVAQALVNLGEFGVELQCLAVVFLCLVQLAQPPVVVGQVGVSQSVGRIEPERFLKFPGRFLVLPLCRKT